APGIVRKHWIVIDTAAVLEHIAPVFPILPGNCNQFWYQMVFQSVRRQQLLHRLTNLTFAKRHLPGILGNYQDELPPDDRYGTRSYRVTVPLPRHDAQAGYSPNWEFKKLMPESYCRGPTETFIVSALMLVEPCACTAKLKLRSN